MYNFIHTNPGPCQCTPLSTQNQDPAIVYLYPHKSRTLPMYTFIHTNPGPCQCTPLSTQIRDPANVYLSQIQDPANVHLYPHKSRTLPIYIFIHTNPGPCQCTPLSTQVPEPYGAGQTDGKPIRRLTTNRLMDARWCPEMDLFPCPVNSFFR